MIIEYTAHIYLSSMARQCNAMLYIYPSTPLAILIYAYSLLDSHIRTQHIIIRGCFR